MIVAAEGAKMETRMSGARTGSRRSSRSRRSVRTLVGVVLLLVLSVGDAVPAYALAPPFEPNPSRSLYYSDNSVVSHRSVECNNADFLHFNHFMHFTYVYDVDPTDLSHSEKTPRPCGTRDSQDDQYWYATAQSNFSTANAVGDWKCFWSSGDKCNRGRIRLLETMRTGSSDATKWNVACHEVAHGLAFDHGDTGLSCMDNGGNGIFDTYMINKINGHY